MEIQIKATGFDLSESIRETIHRKLAVLDRLLSEEVAAGSSLVRVEVAKTTAHHRKGEDIFRAEVMLTLPGETIRVDEGGADLYTLLDTLKDTLAEKVKQYKELRREKGF